MCETEAWGMLVRLLVPCEGLLFLYRLRDWNLVSCRVFFQGCHVMCTCFVVFLSETYHSCLVLIHPSSYVCLLIVRLNIGQFDTLDFDLWHRDVTRVSFLFSRVSSPNSELRCHFDLPTLTILRDGSTFKWASLQPSELDVNSGWIHFEVGLTSELHSSRESWVPVPKRKIERCMSLTVS